MNGIHSIIKDLDERARENYLHASNLFFEARRTMAPDGIVGVAEGDSWFDYKPAWFEDPFHGDLIGHLNTTYDFNIYRISEAADTLENMVYGTEYREESWTPKPAQILETLEVIDQQRPDIFLFSGGGNDFAGEELESYLNHRDSGLPPVRMDHFEAMCNEVFRKAFEDLISKVREVSPQIHIFLHGYDYAIPDGRPVFQLTPGWHFIGPWLRPAFVKKRILQMPEMRDIINSLMDRFNQMLADLAASMDRVHHIDLRGTLSDSDWANELHPKASGFGKIAEVFNEKIREALHH
jgi:lysophospholipase L1-like esterase